MSVSKGLCVLPPPWLPPPWLPWLPPLVADLIIAPLHPLVRLIHRYIKRDAVLIILSVISNRVRDGGDFHLGRRTGDHSRFCDELQARRQSRSRVN